MSKTNGNTKRARGQHSSFLGAGRIMLTAALVSAGLTFSTLATADETAKAKVEFLRGELASAEGLEALHERVLRAAERSCRLHGRRGLSRFTWERQCREEMTQELLTAIDSERLTRLHARRAEGASNDAS